MFSWDFKKAFASFLKFSNPWGVRLGEIFSSIQKYSSNVRNRSGKFELQFWWNKINQISHWFKVMKTLTEMRFRWFVFWETYSLLFQRFCPQYSYDNTLWILISKISIVSEFWGFFVYKLTVYPVHRSLRIFYFLFFCIVWHKLKLRRKKVLNILATFTHFSVYELFCEEVCKNRLTFIL